MSITRKVLWIFNYDGNEDRYKGHVDAAGIDTICVNTRSHQFPKLIDQWKQRGHTVWAWRWPGVRPSEGYGWHYFAPDQAAFVADLFRNHGLDGFIADPESNDDAKPNDWNQMIVDGHSTKDLASNFWQVIHEGAKGRTVHLGITSGWDFPSATQKTKLPWNEFISPVDAVYPQTYWKILRSDGTVKTRWNGDPALGIRECIQHWTRFGKPIVPIAGEIDQVTDGEITQYGTALTELGLTEAHFYDDTANVSPAVLSAIAQLH